MSLFWEVGNVLFLLMCLVLSVAYYITGDVPRATFFLLMFWVSRPKEMRE